MLLYYRWEKLSFSFVMYCAMASYCNIIVVKTNKNMKLCLSYMTVYSTLDFLSEWEFQVFSEYRFYIHTRFVKDSALPPFWMDPYITTCHFFLSHLSTSQVQLGRPSIRMLKTATDIFARSTYAPGCEGLGVGGYEHF